MSLSSLANAHLRDGIKNTKKSSLAICILARDCERYLKKTLKKIALLHKYFKHCEFFIAENNSKDSTPHIISQWCKKDIHHRHIIDVYTYFSRHHSSTLSFVNIFDSTINSSTKHNHIRTRIERMAILRDSVLDAAKKSSKKFEYVLMLDADIFWFSIKGILQCFSSFLPSWHALTANGRVFCWKCIPPFQNIYYDSFAVKPMYEAISPLSWQTHLQKTLSPLNKHAMLFPVESAFGAMALYQYNAIQDIKYTDATEEDGFSFCEHVSFHKQMRKSGHTNIFINPYMMLYYNNPIPFSFYSIIKAVKKRKKHL